MLGIIGRHWLQINLVALVLLVIFSILWNSQQKSISIGLNQHDVPDYFAIQSLTRRYDSKGHLKHRIQAARLQHWPTFKVIEFEQPHMRMHLAAGDEWQAWAEQGSITDTGNLVVLEKNVNINNALESTHPLSLSGESLRIFPDRDYAESSKEVTIVGKHSLSTGTGLELWFSSQRLLLLDNVNGFYNK
jgi:lipopolysaccharide export system protein LptC